MLERLFERIEDRRAALITLTQELVRIPTVNPPGDAYRPCAELIGNRLKARGFEVIYERGLGDPADSDRYPRTNIIARYQGRRPGPCVHFNGHIDVVEVGQGWTKDPFGGEIEDGKIYGRGTCDMKGGLAAAIIAVEAILDSDIDFAGALEISGTVDEETGGYGGVAYLAKKGYFSKPRVDHVIIPEPLNVDRVCIGHRGAWWAEVETHGRIAHGSMPFLGDCAVRHMGAFLAVIEQELIPLLASKKTEMPVVPAEAQCSTLNLNSLHGGQKEGYAGPPAPCVPDSCRLVLDRRFLIEENLEEVKAEVVALLEQLKMTRSNFTYSIKDIMEILPTMTDSDAPVVRAIEMEIARVLGRPAQQVVSPGSYDQKHVYRFGQLKDCIAYGPGILDLAHQPDEYIVIEDMVASAKIMAAAALRLTGDLPAAEALVDGVATPA